MMNLPQKNLFFFNIFFELLLGMLALGYVSNRPDVFGNSLRIGSLDYCLTQYPGRRAISIEKTIHRFERSALSHRVVPLCRDSISIIRMQALCPAFPKCLLQSESCNLLPPLIGICAVAFSICIEYSNW